MCRKKDFVCVHCFIVYLRVFCEKKITACDRICVLFLMCLCAFVLRDKETDASRVKKLEWLVLLGMLGKKCVAKKIVCLCACVNLSALFLFCVCVQVA